MSKISLLFHGDGNSVTGLGHLVRSFGVASELTCDSRFQSKTLIHFTSYNTEVIHKIKPQFETALSRTADFIPLDRQTKSADWAELSDSVFQSLLKITKTQRFDFLFSDGKYPWSPSQLSELNRSVPHLVMIDNVRAASPAVENYIFPTDYFDNQWIPASLQSRVITGSEWLWVHPKVRKTQFDRTIKYNLAITMGGSDPNRQTLQAIDKASQLFKPGASIAVVIGDSFNFRNEIENRCQSHPNFKWHFVTGENLHQALVSSELVFCAFGILAFECEALRKPYVLFSHHEEHKKEAIRYLSSQPRQGVLSENFKIGMAFPTGNTTHKIGEQFVNAYWNYINRLMANG